jgi:hypothetical protein
LFNHLTHPVVLPLLHVFFFFFFLFPFFMAPTPCLYTSLSYFVDEFNCHATCTTVTEGWGLYCCCDMYTEERFHVLHTIPTGVIHTYRLPPHCSELHWLVCLPRRTFCFIPSRFIDNFTDVVPLRSRGLVNLVGVQGRFFACVLVCVFTYREVPHALYPHGSQLRRRGEAFLPVLILCLFVATPNLNVMAPRSHLCLL